MKLRLFEPQRFEPTEWVTEAEVLLSAVVLSPISWAPFVISIGAGAAPADAGLPLPFICCPRSGHESPLGRLNELHGRARV